MVEMLDSVVAERTIVAQSAGSLRLPRAHLEAVGENVGVSPAVLLAVEGQTLLVVMVGLNPALRGFEGHKIKIMLGLVLAGGLVTDLLLISLKLHHELVREHLPH